jgi:hypothetical protein
VEIEIEMIHNLTLTKKERKKAAETVLLLLLLDRCLSRVYMSQAQNEIRVTAWYPSSFLVGLNFEKLRKVQDKPVLILMLLSYNKPLLTSE